jgi:hypothetical protein
VCSTRGSGRLQRALGEIAHEVFCAYTTGRPLVVLEYTFRLTDIASFRAAGLS